MDLVIKMMEVIVPVLVMITLGVVCKWKGIVREEGMEGLKSIIGNITLPVVLFNAFFTAHYTLEVLLIFMFVFISCGIALGIGYWARKWVKPYGRFAPFLMTNFEGGMLGYTLFAMVAGSTAMSTFAMVDIGQTVFAYTVYLAALKVAGGRKMTPKGIAENMIKSPACVGMFAGILLGLLGVHQYLSATEGGVILYKVIEFVSAPTAAIILMVMGYQLSIKKKMIKPVCITVALRTVVMGILFGLCSWGIFSIIPWNKTLQMALMLMFTLPAPFIIPLFVEVKEDGEYISTTLSVSMIVTLLGFMLVCFYNIYI